MSFYKFEYPIRVGDILVSIRENYKCDCPELLVVYKIDLCHNSIEARTLDGEIVFLNKVWDPFNAEVENKRFWYPYYMVKYENYNKNSSL